MKKLLIVTILLGFNNIIKAQENSIKPIECPHPIFKIGNGMSRMPAIALRNITGAKVEMNDFSKSDYKIQEFTIRLLSAESQTFKTAVNNGNSFSEETRTLLSSIKPNDLIMVVGISAIDPKGNTIYVPDRNFAFY